MIHHANAQNSIYLIFNKKNQMSMKLLYFNQFIFYRLLLLFSGAFWVVSYCSCSNNNMKGELNLNSDLKPSVWYFIRSKWKKNGSLLGTLLHSNALTGTNKTIYMKRNEITELLLFFSFLLLSVASVRWLLPIPRHYFYFHLKNLSIFDKVEKNKIYNILYGFWSL